MIVDFKNDTEKLFPSIYNKVNKIARKACTIDIISM